MEKLAWLLVGRTALHFAAGYGNEEACELLLAGGAPPAAVDAHGDTPLHLCAAHGHPMAAFALAKAAPAAVMLTNSRGNTPVECAAMCTNHEVPIQLLSTASPPSAFSTAFSKVFCI